MQIKYFKIVHYKRAVVRDKALGAKTAEQGSNLPWSSGQRYVNVDCWNTNTFDLKVLARVQIL